MLANLWQLFSQPEDVVATRNTQHATGGIKYFKIRRDKGSRYDVVKKDKKSVDGGMIIIVTK